MNDEELERYLEESDRAFWQRIEEEDRKFWQRMEEEDRKFWQRISEEDIWKRIENGNDLEQVRKLREKAEEARRALDAPEWDFIDLIKIGLNKTAGAVHELYDIASFIFDQNHTELRKSQKNFFKKLKRMYKGEDEAILQKVAKDLSKREYWTFGCFKRSKDHVDHCIMYEKTMKQLDEEKKRLDEESKLLDKRGKLNDEIYQRLKEMDGHFKFKEGMFERIDEAYKQKSLEGLLKIKQELELCPPPFNKPSYAETLEVELKEFKELMAGAGFEDAKLAGTKKQLEKLNDEQARYCVMAEEYAGKERYYLAMQAMSRAIKALKLYKAIRKRECPDALDKIKPPWTESLKDVQGEFWDTEKSSVTVDVEEKIKECKKLLEKYAVQADEGISAERITDYIAQPTTQDRLLQAITQYKKARKSGIKEAVENAEQNLRHWAKVNNYDPEKVIPLSLKNAAPRLYKKVKSFFQTSK